MYTLTQEQVNELAKGKSIQEVLPEAFKLEVWKWYKGSAKSEKSLYFIQDIDDSAENGVLCYGRNRSGYWSPSMRRSNYSLKNEFTEATREEVEAMLIAEAKKRGFVEGANVKGLDSYSGVLSLGKCIGNDSGYYYSSYFNWLVANVTPEQNTTIFNNGKWATIVHEPKSDILTELIDYATTNDNLWLKNKLEKLR